MSRLSGRVVHIVDDNIQTDRVGCTSLQEEPQQWCFTLDALRKSVISVQLHTSPFKRYCSKLRTIINT